MLGVDDARAVARKKYQANFAAWAVAHARPRGAVLLGSDRVNFELPLHPPTEKIALDDPDRVYAWNDAWRESNPAFLVRVRRTWTRLGSQDVPERLRFGSAAEIAEFAGTTRHWQTVSTRVAALMDALGPSDTVTAAIRRRARAVASMEAVDVTRLHGVLRWLIEHPDSGLYIRQLPIRGVDTKWIGAHRSLVTDLFTAATMHDGLGLAEPPRLVRMRVLDPTLLPVTLRDISAPVAELAALDIRPSTVFVFENLESVVAMAAVPGAVVVHGSGYAVDRLGQIPWIRDARIVYWGDLDSHGFSILNRIRQHCDDVTSVLMDTATLETHRDLWGQEPSPATGKMSHLTEDEQTALDVIRSYGDVRMEQERIEWHHALRMLRRASDGTGA